jgi:hypothetical protein
MSGPAAAGTPGAHDDDGQSAAGPGEITAGMLRATFPQWHIARNGGTWWAVRGGLARLDGPESLLLRVITARDLGGLAERLCLQDYLDRLSPEELAAVYRDMRLPGAAG